MCKWIFACFAITRIGYICRMQRHRGQVHQQKQRLKKQQHLGLLQMVQQIGVHHGERERERDAKRKKHVCLIPSEASGIQGCVMYINIVIHRLMCETHVELYIMICVVQKKCKTRF